MSVYGPPRASTAAVALLVLAAVLLANPLYVRSPPDRGSVLVSVERTSAAGGAADRSPDVARVDDLPPVARYAADRALDDGTYAAPSDGPPLVLRLLGDEWRYLGSAETVAFYRPTVTVGENATTLDLERRSVSAVESDLGVTPPGRFNETGHPKEVLWLDQQSDETVVVGAFDDGWERRLRRAVENGTLVAPNGNDADAFAPLGGDVRFVAHDDTFYRATVEAETAGATDETVALRLAPERDEAALSEADVDVVETSDCSPRTRRVVEEAIASDGYTQVHRDEVNVTELDALQGRLIRREGAYYVLRRGYADDFDLTPLFRMALTAAGLVAALLGLAIGAWARRT